jgi:D-alanyl-lipoteichoic acid acyltransferase DltB (MBOAT superfamily)
VSVYFLTWLSNFSATAPLLALYVLGALALGWALRGREERGGLLLVSIGCTGCLAVLLLFKYHPFLPDVAQLQKLLVRVRLIEWIGLSYLTFRTIDYLTCMRQEAAGDGTGGPRWLYGCSYLLFFPGYVSGPINRFRLYVDEQTKEHAPLTLVRLRDNLLRISLGIIKILLLGRLARSYSMLGPEFGGFANASFSTLTISLYACYLYYYFDFSGYCDVAIALADFFEVRLPENFNYPFLASSPQDFWNRWHVSLTHWLRDFVFFRLFAFVSLRWPAIPELLTLMVSSFVTLVLVGAWHGNSPNWVLYGCYHGAFLCLHLGYRQAMEAWCPELYDRLKENGIYRGACIFLTFNYIAWGLLLTLPLQALQPLLLRILG